MSINNKDFVPVLKEIKDTFISLACAKENVLDEFKAIKEKGEKLDINIITKEEYIGLFYDSSQSKGMIAELFDCTVKEVDKLHRKFNISLDNIRTARAKQVEIGEFTLYFVMQLVQDHNKKETLTREDISESLITIAKERLQMIQEKYV